MVKKLRKKFVITAMGSLLCVLLAIISIINIVNLVQIQNDADSLLTILAENDGQFPEFNRDRDKIGKQHDSSDSEGEQPADANMASSGELPEPPQDMLEDDSGNAGIDYHRNIEMPYQSRYFWVRLSEEGKASEINTGHIAAISSDQAQEYAEEVFATGNEHGYKNNYRYNVTTKDDGTILVIFKDCNSEFYSARQLLFTTLIIGVLASIAMFILVYVFSGNAVAPVVESLEKQKRFITDAGHELKTPIAVISANIDVLELESGKSEWTASIRNQVNRMTSLVKNLLTLSRMDEENIHPVFSDMDMSNVISECAKSFQAVADSKNKKYNMEIQDNIHINGDKNNINQLASLLIDNAMKYSSEEGTINVRLSKDKNVVFEVSNTSDCIPEGNLDRLFDRFYRADSSRSRETGGYGIGLSVARAIATSHGGRIEAKKDGDRLIRFIVTIPVKKK
ncbi:MAG: HAMP domain-containing histidine kinase [Butyrivibrio sp.]|nr:HAMP domain-containing histidine kinase [Butyrivibrio sp.]